MPAAGTAVETATTVEASTAKTATVETPAGETGHAMSPKSAAESMAEVAVMRA